MSGAQDMAITDPVGEDTPGAREIGFAKADHPDCSEVLWQNLSRNPDSPALVGPAGSLTYRQVCAQAARWGHAFTAAGCRRGERIAFLLDDTPVLPAAFFGAVRAGFVPVLLNTQSDAGTLGYFLQDSGARLCLCEAELTDRVGEASAGRPLEQVIVANGPAPAPCVSADRFVEGQPDSLDPSGNGPDDMAFWMYSSGSTGRPKGVVHLHHDMAYTAASYGRHVLALQPGDICFSVPKIFFAYGFGNSITFPFAVGAASLLLPGRPEPERVIEAIERFRPTVLFGLPTLYTALCRMEGVAARDLSSLRLSISAAETLSQDISDAWRSLTGLSAIEGLGSTEVLHIYLSNTAGEQRIGSAGRRVPGYEIVLRDPDGREAGAGEEGVMWVRGTSSAPLYWNRPESTQSTMRGDWIHTGDRFVERDGHYHFQGRADDLVKVSGQWVWPMEVERCLAEHPHVHECAVLAHTLPDGRTTLRAMVSLRSGQAGDESQRAALRAHVRQALLPHKAPRLVEFVDSLPKTGTGKIDRQALAARPVAAPAGDGSVAAP